VPTVFSRAFPVEDRVSNKSVWFYFDRAIEKYYENRIWSLFTNSPNEEQATSLHWKKFVIVFCCDQVKAQTELSFLLQGDDLAEG